LSKWSALVVVAQVVKPQALMRHPQEAVVVEEDMPLHSLR